MIRTKSQHQLTLAEFDWPFQVSLDENNRWVKLSQCIPWDEMAAGYYQSLSQTRGLPAKDARLVIGAVIIKHKLCLSDEETVAQIQENPYLQYFVGLPGYQMKEPFVPSLFVEIRKRMGQSVFEVFHQSLIDAVDNLPTTQNKQQETVKDNDDADDPPSTPGRQDDASDNASHDLSLESHKGKLTLDATVAPQAIRYPTDLSLLNEAREFTEQIIDALYRDTDLASKPRTYRQKARKEYLAIAKLRKASGKVIRRGLRQQLQYLKRNLKHIDGLLEHFPIGKLLPLKNRLLYRYWVIPHLYHQQREMYKNKSRRCDNRIVSISQPYVRPIVRGKQDKPVEFGAKLSVSLTQAGLSRVDHLRWDAFHEGGDLKAQILAYHERYGHYPEVVLGDPVYGTRDNRNWLKDRGIRFGGKPLGRPAKETDENREAMKQAKARRREEYLQRIPIEGKFGQGKNGYNLNYIRAKRADTSSAWINSIFLVMNLLILLKVFILHIIFGLAERIVWLKHRLLGLWLQSKWTWFSGNLSLSPAPVLRLKLRKIHVPVF